MSQNNTIGKQAFKLYNNVSATEQDKVKAIILIEQESAAELDDYGKFTRAEIIFWKRNSSKQEQADAFDTFRSMSINPNLPKVLIVGARFYAARCYELGFATDHNFEAALMCYRKANELNPKACLKDIARMEKAITNADKKTAAATPDKYKYRDGIETSGEHEYRDSISEWAKDFEKCQTSLKENKFFYADDSDEVNVDDLNIYDIDTDE